MFPKPRSHLNYVTADGRLYLIEFLLGYPSYFYPESSTLCNKQGFEIQDR